MVVVFCRSWELKYGVVSSGSSSGSSSSNGSSNSACLASNTTTTTTITITITTTNHSMFQHTLNINIKKYQSLSLQDSHIYRQVSFYNQLNFFSIDLH